jgi:hypothetical protein
MPSTPCRVDSAATTGHRGRRRPHVTCALSSRCSCLRSSHDSPLSRTPAHSFHGASCLALLHCHLLEHCLILGLLPEPSAAARSRPQATLCHRFFRREDLSMDRLVRSSYTKEHQITLQDLDESFTRHHIDLKEHQLSS